MRRRRWPRNRKGSGKESQPIRLKQRQLQLVEGKQALLREVGSKRMAKSKKRLRLGRRRQRRTIKVKQMPKRAGRIKKLRIEELLKFGSNFTNFM